MNRPFYSEYVKHAMRFYARTISPQPHFKSEADRANWLSCQSVLKHYPDEDRDILISVYGGFDTLADEVYNVSKKHKINQNIIWDMMKEFERKVARKRGLI